MVMQKKENLSLGQEKKVICLLVTYKEGREPYVNILFSDLRPPWSLHFMGRNTGNPIAGDSEWIMYHIKNRGVDLVCL